MEESVEIGSYEPGRGLKLTWNQPGYELAVFSSFGEMTIKGNPAGRRTLAQHLLTLAAEGVPDGTHIHLEPKQELEDDSLPLILSRGTN